MLDRRAFMRWLAASSALPLVGCADDSQDRTFPQGIASGDPTSDGVLLWTRVEPHAPAALELVAYEVARDPELRHVVAGGTVDALPDADHTVRVAIAGLAAATTYWYRFRARGVTSPVGRTRTAPARDADAPLRIALASCQDYGGRWFGAWRAVDDDVDLVLFIGDYIYETIGHLAAVLPPDRTPAIPDGLVLDDPLKGSVAALTLADYRALYRQYRRDPDLRAVHARFPFVMMWDDHEFANDCWRDHATDFDDARGDERSPERRAAATRAWYDYCPVRRDRELYRSLRWGRHAELVLIDERSYRDDDLIPEGPVDAEVGHIMMNSAFGARTFVIKDAFDAREAAAVPPPSMLGTAQRDWAIAAVQGSTATWKLLASPLVMAQLVIDLTGYAQLPDQFRKRFYFKTDQWDGFRSERRALLEACAGVDNLVVLSGDLHGFYAAELHADFDAPAAEPIAVEYAVSAISAATVDVQLDAVVAAYPLLGALGLADLVPQLDANARAANPHLVHSESTRNGLAIVDVAPDEVRVRFVHVDDVTSPEGAATDSVAFRTPLGSRRVLPYGG